MVVRWLMAFMINRRHCYTPSFSALSLPAPDTTLPYTLPVALLLTLLVLALLLALVVRGLVVRGLLTLLVLVARGLELLLLVVPALKLGSGEPSNNGEGLTKGSIAGPPRIAASSHQVPSLHWAPSICRNRLHVSSSLRTTLPLPGRLPALAIGFPSFPFWPFRLPIWIVFGCLAPW